MYVIAKFSEEKTKLDYHFVGKVVGKEHHGEVEVNYYRWNWNVMVFLL